MGFPGSSMVKNTSATAGDKEEVWSLVGKILWRKKWQPTPAFLPAEPHGPSILRVTKSWMQPSMYTLERIFWARLVKRRKFWRPPCQEEEEGFANIILELMGLLWVGVWSKWDGACVHAKSLQSCWTLCDPMDCSPPSFSVLGIFQAWILGWVAMPSYRESSQSGDWTHVSYVSCISD